MTSYTKYLPHIGLTALIIFLATDFFPSAGKSVLIDPVKTQTMKDGTNNEGSHKKGKQSLIPLLNSIFKPSLVMETSLNFIIIPFINNYLIYNDLKLLINLGFLRL